MFCAKLQNQADLSTDRMMLVIEWLKTQLDTVDLIVLSVVLLSAVYYLWKNRLTKAADKYAPAVLPSYTPIRCAPDRQISFITRMKSEGRKVLIIYGSQTGTAEELAGRLAKDVQNYGQKALLVDPEEMDLEDFARIKEIDGLLVILCMATYGEGDPTDNAQDFYQHISESDMDLKGIQFAVLIIYGSQTGTAEELAGRLAKDVQNYGQKALLVDPEEMDLEDFARIKEIDGLLVILCMATYGEGDPTDNAQDFYQHISESDMDLKGIQFAVSFALSKVQYFIILYRFEILEDPCAKLFTGEYGRLGSFEKQRPPFDQKNPFIATVGVNRELHGEKSERSCRHIEFVTNAARIRYETGDHLGVFPTNDPNLVDELAKLIGVNMDLSFSLINLDEESLKKNPFPCPCTVRTALTHYVDICAPVKSHVLRALASFTSDETERERLLLLSTANQQGLVSFCKKIFIIFPQVLAS
ncbi:unnamed protein product [Gongylonema pulchrum]|uniref:Flavodoxin-like domain-containing protein n=1 Tax=Gongylonema pulchrum TaxID=637853 RepID=A0A183DR22_9BILA|nr:unnamed protein product [Gongylonema pulchrum]